MVTVTLPSSRRSTAKNVAADAGDALFDLASRFHHGRALDRRGVSGLSPFEKANAVFHLEPGDLAKHRAGVDPKALGGRYSRALVGDGDDETENVPVDVLHICRLNMQLLMLSSFFAFYKVFKMHCPDTKPAVRSALSLSAEPAE